MHNHMHCESFIFTNKLLGYSNPMDMSYYLENNNIEYKWVKIPGGDFYQGTYEGQYNITFDNEMPKKAFAIPIMNKHIINIISIDNIIPIFN